MAAQFSDICFNDTVSINRVGSLSLLGTGDCYHTNGSPCRDKASLTPPLCVIPDHREDIAAIERTTLQISESLHKTATFRQAT